MLPDEVTPVSLSYAEVRQALKTDLEFMLNFFLSDQKLLRTPDFHLILWKLLITIEAYRVVLAIPRGHSKTTLSKLAVIWYLLFTPYRFCVYVSHTATSAANAARDIINMLESDNFISAFGVIRFEKRAEGDGLYIFFLGDKRCILKAQGAGQQLRGMNIDNERPGIAIVDDLEDEENIKTPAQQEKLIRWFLGTFIKALAKNNKIIYLGNMLSPQCLIKKLCALPDWHSMRLGAILQNGQPLWPELWSLPALIADYRTYQILGQTDIWMAEMMNSPQVAENRRLINAEDITYTSIKEPDDLAAGFITVDPATGKTRSDDTGIVVHGLVAIDDPNQLRPEIIDHLAGKFDEMRTVQLAIALAWKWHISVIGIEATAYQVALKTLFELYMVMHGIEGIEIVELHAVAQKLTRITSWVSLLRTGAYAIRDDDIAITNQLLAFDIMKNSNDDDIIDSCSYGTQMIENYYGLIITKLYNIPESRFKFVSEEELCSI